MNLGKMNKTQLVDLAHYQGAELSKLKKELISLDESLIAMDRFRQDEIEPREETISTLSSDLMNSRELANFAEAKYDTLFEDHTRLIDNYIHFKVVYEQAMKDLAKGEKNASNRSEVCPEEESR